MTKKYQYLDKVNFPSDVKKLKQSELKILAKEVREEMLDAVSVTGGHLGAGLGVVELTDVGCMHRCIRRESLEKILDQFVEHGTDEPIISPQSGLFAILMTMIGIENNLKIVEVPITFKKRIGISKTESDKKIRAVRYGLTFFWYIISR